jgi:hypothetical protein
LVVATAGRNGYNIVAPWVEQLREEDIELVNSKFVTRNLKDRESDIIYNEGRAKNEPPLPPSKPRRRPERFLKGELVPL